MRAPAGLQPAMCAAEPGRRRRNRAIGRPHRALRKPTPRTATRAGSQALLHAGQTSSFTVGAPELARPTAQGHTPRITRPRALASRVHLCAECDAAVGCSGGGAKLAPAAGRPYVWSCYVIHRTGGTWAIGVAAQAMGWVGWVINGCNDRGALECLLSSSVQTYTRASQHVSANLQHQQEPFMCMERGGVHGSVSARPGPAKL